MKIVKCYRILTLLSFCLVGCDDQQEAESRPPNVVFILVDDLGAHDLGYAGSNYYETPYIDRLAAQSMNFTNGYAASRVCSPSRASIMTGLYPTRHGITDWIGAKTDTAWRSLNRHDKLLPARYVHQLSSDYTTLPEALKSVGYKTFFAGKWHLGDEGSYPEDHGFDINVGGFENGYPAGGFFSPYQNPKMSDGKKGENLSVRLAQETADFIEAHQDTTFFAFLSFYAVHAPIQTTQPKWQHYQQKAEEQGIADSGFVMERVLPIRVTQDNPVYAGLVSAVDDGVGIVMEQLKKLGLEDNTVVIFTSDNGGVASGDNYATSNLPLRGGKGYQWEGGIREPYLIRVPGLNQGGQTSDVPVNGIDFYPTILDLVSADLTPQQSLDGVSLMPVLQGQPMAERALFWHYPHYGNQGGEPSSIIREGDWKLIHYWEDNREELYDLRHDINEQQDLVAERPAVAQQLSKKLTQWLTETNAKIPVKDPIYDAKLDQQQDEYIARELLPELEAERRAMLSPNWQPNADWWGSQPTAE